MGQGQRGDALRGARLLILGLLAVFFVVGQPQPNGSVGECEKCHLRHEFSLEQARKPETCSACHIVPDHPQWEIY